MSESPKTNKDQMVNLAAFLSETLQKAANEQKRNEKLEHYRELGVKWDERRTELTLPGDPRKMTPQEGIEVLVDFIAQESQEYTIREYLPGMPHDAAHAFVQVLKSRYGWVNPQTKMTIFGPEPPEMVRAYTGPGAEDYIEVPIGKFKLQDVPNADLETGFARNPKSKSGSFLSFFVSATVKHKERKVIMDLINATRDYLAANSIYRGKAMRLPVDRNGEVEASVAPSFIDLSKVSESNLILTKVNYDLLNHTVWTPIRKTAIARKHNIPLKRGALLWGPYGTGKSLSAVVTARIAQDNGWTFIMVDDAKGLVQALEMAQLYQPAVVFAEDIDRAVVRDRDDAANDILNTIDNAVTKNAEIITILTTNHIDKIHQGMLRPGRLDALIHVTKPDAEAAEKLVRYYAGDLLGSTVPLTALGKLIADEGYIPAIIAEIVNRAKLGMIFREETQLVEDDLLTAAELMRAHSKLLEPDDKEPSPEEQVGLALKRLWGDPASSYSGDLQTDLENIRREASEAESSATAAYSIVGQELPKIRKLLERGTNGSGNGADLSEVKTRLAKIAVAVGAGQ